MMQDCRIPFGRGKSIVLVGRSKGRREWRGFVKR